MLLWDYVLPTFINLNALLLKNNIWVWSIFVMFNVFIQQNWKLASLCPPPIIFWNDTGPIAIAYNVQVVQCKIPGYALSSVCELGRAQTISGNPAVKTKVWESLTLRAFHSHLYQNVSKTNRKNGNLTIF